jgi:hypothetical protein
MANGGANISRGMGRGAAQVYDTSAPINMYARLMQQQQLRRAAEQKLLTDELSKVSSDGIREADIPEFTQKYQEVKDFFGLKEGIKDRREKINYELEFNKKIQELKQIAGDSKNIAKNEQGFTNVLLNPSARERYTEDAVTKFQNSKKLSRKDPNFIRDYTVFEHQVDVSNTMKELADINKRILAPIKSVTEQEATRVGNVDGTFIRKVKRAPVEEQALAFGMAMDVNPKLKAGILKLIPINEGESYVDYKSRALPLLVAQLPAEEYGDQSFQPNKDLTMQNLAIQRERRLAAKDSGIGEIGEVEVNKDFFGKGARNVSGERVKKPVKTIGFDYFIKPTQKNFASTQLTNVLNLNTGKNQMMNADTNAALIGLGYTKTKGGKLQLKAVIVNSDKDEFAVNELDLPITVRNSDEYRAAKNKLKSEYQLRNQTKPTAQPATANDQDKAALEWLKSNPNAPQAKAIKESLKAKGLIK